MINNRNICKMIIDNKEFEIAVKYNSKNDQQNFLKIKLKLIYNIINMSIMFYGCTSLKSLPDISKLNTDKATNMNIFGSEFVKK